VFETLVGLVEKLLLQGNTEKKVVNLLLENLSKPDRVKSLGFTEGNVPVEKDIKKAIRCCYKNWKTEARTTDLNIARKVAKLRHLYEKSYSENDYKSCILIEVELDKYEGELPDASFVGRPKAEVDVVLVERLAGIGCTDREIAFVLKVSEDTFRRRKKDDVAVLDAYNKGKGERLLSLRRRQDKAAMAGNVSMLIFLGKQELGQSDQITIERKDPYTKKMDEIPTEELIDAAGYGEIANL
jgi:hypothetical protein